MPIPAAIVDGHLVRVRPARAEDHIKKEEHLLEEVVDETQKLSDAPDLEGTCKAFLSKLLDQQSLRSAVEWWEMDDVQSSVDSVSLMFLGFHDQSDEIVPVAMTLLSRPKRWVTRRIARLKKMGMWAHDNLLGDRFSAWIEDDKHSHFKQFLDLMEIEGLIRSEMRGGELYFKSTKAGLKSVCDNDRKTEDER